MGRAKETFGKKEVRNKQLKKRKDKEKKRLEKKDGEKKNSLDDMLAWVDENGQICSAPPDLSKTTEVNLEDIEISVPKGGFVKETVAYKGKISNFDETKGFGFISSPQLTESVFVHANDCQEIVKTGYKVEFETERGVKGLKAINVKVIAT